MTGLMKRIFRHRAEDESPQAGVASMLGGRARGARLPGYRSFGLGRLRGRLPWGARWAPAAADEQVTQETDPLVAAATAPNFKDRSQLRRRLRFLRRTRELGFRDVGGLIFDMRRFSRNRPDLLDAKLDALQAVDQELRTLERLLDDRRPIHELREPGISACPRCGALHSSESNFCPQCGLQISGPRAMGELGGAIAAPPRPPIPNEPSEPIWSWPTAPPVDRPTSPTVTAPEPDQPTTSYVPALSQDVPALAQEVPVLSLDEPVDARPRPAPPLDEPVRARDPPPAAATGDSATSGPETDAASPEPESEPKPEAASDPSAPKPKPKPKRRPAKRRSAPAKATAADDVPVASEEPTQTNLPPQASG